MSKYGYCISKTAGRLTAAVDCFPDLLFKRLWIFLQGRTNIFRQPSYPVSLGRRTEAKDRGHPTGAAWVPFRFRARAEDPI